MSELIAVDVGADFIETVAAHAEKRLKREKTLTVLFPNRRAVRFFEKRMASPLQLRITAMALEDFAKERVFSLSAAPPTYPCDIDRFLALHDIIQDHPGLYQRLGGTLDRVFPWCVYLSDLFDEFDQNLIPSVAPLPYIDEVVPEAKEILRSLDTLYEEYRRVMEKENLTFRGDLFRRLNALKDRLSGPFMLAGFALLTEAQTVIFRHLFRYHDTTVFFHTDLRGRHPVTNPYRLYDTWMDGSVWGVRPKEIRHSSQDADRPSIDFHESFDTHAEAKQLSEALSPILTRPGVSLDPLDVGVILPESQALFPVLYTLKGFDAPMNITLGFPFEKSIFYRLLESLTDLALTRDEHRGFYHLPLEKFLAHPFIRFLRIGGVPFGETAERLQREIVTRNLAFVRFEALTPSETFPADDLRLCRRLDAEILSPFTTARSLREAGNALTRLIHGIAETLTRDDTADFERQMVQNFLDRVLPGLTLSRSAERELSSPRILCGVLRHLASPLHIPFEGNPLEGIQIMGMLESRLLNFTHLFILDVNEGILPKGTKVDPLFPPALNPLVGLPSLKAREALFRYNFFRLVDGAQNVHVFYQRGVTGEEKRIRSRYVEQLLLEEEMAWAERNRDASIRELEADLVHTFTFQIPPPLKPDPKRPAFYAGKLTACLSHGVSASFLDDYLFCPHRFYLRRILGMPEEEGVQESQSPVDVGNMVHRILETTFSAVRHVPLSSPLLKKLRETALSKVAPAAREGFPALSSLRLDLLVRLTTHRLNALFNEAEAELFRYRSIRIIETEKPLKTRLEDYTLVGKVDRIDAIEETAGTPTRWRIIDYKTGTSARLPAAKIRDFLKSFDFSDYSLAALAALRGVLHSFQLPLYLYLFRKTAMPKKGERIDVVLYLLGNPPGEIVSEPFRDDLLNQEQIASLVLYLIEHMHRNPDIGPYDTASCPGCPYVRICRHTSRAPAVQR